MNDEVLVLLFRVRENVSGGQEIPTIFCRFKVAVGRSEEYLEQNFYTNRSWSKNLNNDEKNMMLLTFFIDILPKTEMKSSYISWIHSRIKVSST